MAFRQLISSGVKAPSLYSFVTSSHCNVLSSGLLAELRGKGCSAVETLLCPHLAVMPVCYRSLHQSHHHSESGTKSATPKPTPITRANILQDPACGVHSLEQTKISSGNFSTSKKQLGKEWFPHSWKQNFEFFSVRSLLSTPFPFMAYGLGGLIPFMAAPAYMQAVGYYSPILAQTQLVYGACILSFLGGVNWGDQIAKAEKASLESLSFSILLPLIAWPGVLLYPNVSSFAVIITGVVYAAIRDTGNQRYPRWFRNLRFVLSVLVSGSLLTTAIFKFSKSPKGTLVKSEETHVSEKEGGDK